MEKTTRRTTNATQADPKANAIVPQDAQVISPDGTITVVVPENGTDFKLPELYRHADCKTVEMVPMPDGRTMWVDEDGIRNGKPANPEATKLVAKWLGSGDFIKGKALVCPKRMVR